MDKHHAFRFDFGLAIAIATIVLLGHGTVSAAQPTTDMTLPPLARLQSERVATAATGATGGTPGQAPVYEAAPIPNLDALPPRGVTQTRGAAIEPTLYVGRGGYRGDGFTPGSSPQATQQPRHIPLPGINLKMPLN